MNKKELHDCGSEKEERGQRDRKGHKMKKSLMMFGLAAVICGTSGCFTSLCCGLCELGGTSDPASGTWWKCNMLQRKLSRLRLQ